MSAQPGRSKASPRHSLGYGTLRRREWPVAKVGWEQAKLRNVKYLASAVVTNSDGALRLYQRWFLFERLLQQPARSLDPPPESPRGNQVQNPQQHRTQLPPGTFVRSSQVTTIARLIMLTGVHGVGRCCPQATSATAQNMGVCRNRMCRQAILLPQTNPPSHC